MKLLNNFFTTLLLLLSYFIGFATDGITSWSSKMGPQKSFIENKGQFRIASDEALTKSSVKYAFDDGSTMIYFTPNGVTYNFLKRWKKTEGKSDAKEMAREREREQKEMAKGKSHAEIEKEEHRMEFKTDVVNMIWENANPNAQLVAEQQTDDYFIYPDKTANNDKNIENIKAYKKLIYKNLYPNIDIEYTFHPESGIKYALILHPGADISVVKMKYSNGIKLAENGVLHIPTKFGNIIEHAPVTFYKGAESNIISSQFINNGKIVSFLLGNYDHSKTVIVDPWVQTPTLTNSNSVWECERDAAGNVYIIGGDTPMKLLKYNPTGILQWTYNTTWDTANYWLGTFAVDLAGNSYVTSGTQSKISKVGTTGANIWTNNSIGGNSQELWNITFNCDQTRLIIGGTTGILTLRGAIFDLDVTNGNVLTTKIVGYDKPLLLGALAPDEVRSICSAPNGKYYFLILDSVGRISQNFTACSSNSSLYKINSTYDFAYYNPSYRYDNSGIMAIRANKNFVYTQNGSTISKRSLSSLTAITTVTIPGGINVTGAFGNPGQVPGSSGLDIDSCGNVYVGSANSVIKYDANLNLISSVALPFTVFDVSVSTSGNVIVAGATTGSGVRTGYVQSISSFTACNPMISSCCNATICFVNPLCVTAPPVTLQGATTGGIWSGLGVNTTTGIFTPATAGVGTHIIVYTLACGSDSVSITVNACTPTSACQELSGQITVSGGTGPYTWQQQVTTNPCIAGIGFCSGFGTVAGPPVTSWSTFATGTTITPPGTYPIQVIDNSGTTLVITSLASLPNCSSCPTLTVNITSQVNVSCFGASTGSFNASTTGGASPWDYTLMNGATTVATFINIAGTQSFTGLPAGTYTLNVLDNNGCPGTTTITITQPAAATTVANAGSTQSACSTSFTMAGNTPTVGTGTWTLISGAGTITAAGSPTTTITAVGAGSNVFMWTISNPPCPASTDTVTLINTGGPTTSVAGSNQTICATTTTLAGNTPTVGTGLWTVVSGTGTITTPTSPTSGLTGLGVGPNVFQWTISNGTCTPSSSTVTITGVAAPTVSNAGPNQSICSTSTTLAGNTPTTGSGTWTLVSGAGTITTPSSATSGVTGLGVGSTVFQWTISNVPCPSSSSTVTITNSGGPGINTVSQTNVICNGGSTGTATVAGFGGTGSYTYLWSGGAGTNASATGLVAATYTVTVTDGAGCSSITLVTITQPAAIAGSVSTTPATCGVSDGSATATASGGSGTLTYSWLPGGATTSSITAISSGTYTVTITDSLGCVYAVLATVGSVGGPTVNAGTNVTIISGTSTVLTGTGSTGSTYSWSPSSTLTCDTCATTIASPTQTTTYTLTVTANGCSSFDTVTVFVEAECGELFVPNVFSPNNDGQNDVLKVYGNCITDFEFVIFDRWGEKVFEITNPAIVWDGRYNGKVLETGVFVYYLVGKVKGIEVKKHGNITLVK